MYLQENASFSEDYKNLIYQYFSDKIEFKKHSYQESASVVLEEIVSISNKYKKLSNSILHALLYIYDKDKNFTDVYSVSKEIFLLKEDFENIVINPIKDFAKEERERILMSDGENKTPLQWVTENRSSLLINLEKNNNQYHYKFYVLVNDVFTLYENTIFDMEFFKYNHNKIVGFVKSNFLNIPNDWLLIVPLKRSISISNSINVLGVGMFYLGRDFLVVDKKINNFSYAELKESKKALSILSEIASEYHSIVEYEKNKVLKGLKDLSGLYLHSFSQYGSRIEENLSYSGKDVTLNGFTLENLQNIKQIQIEIEELKNKLVKKLKHVNFNLIKLDYTLRKFIKSKKIRFLLSKENISFTYFFNYPNEIKIHIDESVLVEILFTIIDNSIKAVSEIAEKKINVTANVISEFIIISVSDNGEGLTKNKTNKIFSTQSMSGWQSESKKGAGTGLFLCRVLLSLFSGEIYFQKKSFNNMSTTISIKIPIPKEIN